MQYPATTLAAGPTRIHKIRWTRHNEHDNFALSVAGTLPDLNTDLTLTPLTLCNTRSQLKKYSIVFKAVENRTILTLI